MRTWTLTQAGWSERVDDFVVDGPDVGEPNQGIEPSVQVIELEPVLDLLERLEDALQTAPDSELGPEPERDASLKDVRSVLSAHGRLDG